MSDRGMPSSSSSSSGVGPSPSSAAPRKEPERDWVPLRPKFVKEEWSDAEGLQRTCEEFLRAFAVELEEIVARGQPANTASVRALRAENLWRAGDRLGKACQPARALISLLSDLICQEWRVQIVGEEIQVKPPEANVSRAAEKERVRRALLLARQDQLSQPPVRSFVKSMERKRPHRGGWCSILSLMRDGEALAAELREVAANGSSSERIARLRRAIQPYLQFIGNEEERCERTGFRLSDIWRYFRYTWSSPLRSTPGRSMMILIRDAAVEPHPVLGIAALSSSIVQLRTRDEWIGWTREAVLTEIADAPSDALAAWLCGSLRELIEGIYVRDFLEEGLLSEATIAQPTDRLIDHLRQTGLRARREHQLQSRAAEYKREQEEGEWSSQVRLPLYRSKRALALATLLGIRNSFLQAGFIQARAQELRSALESQTFRWGIAQLVRYIKASRVGINMMDISTLGAIPPYNSLLGGKLVSLLMASPEVRLEYRRRYSASPSVIASAMKGEAVARQPDLVLLCTTGLFGAATSQYNRLSMPASRAGGQWGEIRYNRLRDLTQYSTFHVSQETMEELKTYTEQWQGGSDVHNIFGEGVNPKLRKLREGFDRLEIDADEILQPVAPRAVYMIPLAHNYRDILLGRGTEPDDILPGDEPRRTTERIADFWRERWLDGRITRPGVLEALAAHQLTYPLTHGAVVALPDEGQLDFEYLFSGTEEELADQ